MTRQRSINHVVIVLALLASAVAATAHPAHAIDTPSGFVSSTIATDIQNPVGMEVDHTGLLYVLAGNQRRIELFDDDGYVGEFADLPQAASLGSGLLGLEFAPDFATSGIVYIAYITDTSVVSGPQRFRLSRFDSANDQIDPASEQVLFEVDDIDPGQQQHQGGDLAFGPDGKLYWTLGDRVEGTTVSQSLDWMFGKVLRLNPDGTIPSDNPFYDTLSGQYRAIYGLGLRNPYRVEAHPTTREVWMSEVGPQDWEEVNVVQAGANYGWPTVSGVSGNPAFTDPIHAYNHVPDGCAITGGAFYEAAQMSFPAEYHGDFFYGDHCFGWIAHFDPVTGTDTRFATGADRLVEIKVNPVDGTLYYLDREYNGDNSGRKGGIGKIEYELDIDLEITRQPADVSAAIGESATFDVLVSGQAPFTYQWERDGQPIPGETSSALTLPSVLAADDGAQFTVVVGDASGETETSDPAVLTVTTNNAPVPVITDPNAALRYIAGQEYTFAGTATDVEDGPLDPSALSWKIEFHHDDHTHPFIPELDGVASGTFTPPTNDETSPNVWYRIHLTATDSDGASTTVTHDVLPLQVDVTLDTAPSGLDVLLDGATVTTPHTFTGVAGVTRVIEAPAQQTSGGQTATFVSWSDGGARAHPISTPLVDTTYLAQYDTTGVDLPPTVVLDVPEGGSVVAADEDIAGTASDDLGVTGVQVIIKKQGTTEHWDGTQFVPGWRANDAILEDQGAMTTNWSYPFRPAETTAVRVTVKAIDTAGQKSERDRANATFVVDEGPFDPSITIVSPTHQSTVANPVTFTGTVTDALEGTETIVIKRRGTRQYWNGSNWQAGWVMVPVDSIVGDTWTYVMALPQPVDVVAFGRALDMEGVKMKSSKVVVFVT